MDERFDEGQETKGNQGNGEWNESQMGQNESRMNQNGGQMSRNDSQKVNVVQGRMENLGYENGFHMEQMESPKNRKERRRQEKLQKQALKKERKEKRRHSFVAKAGRMVAYGILFGGAFGVAFQGIQMGSNYLLTGSFYPAEASSSKKTTKEIQNVELLTTTKETDSSVAWEKMNTFSGQFSVK